MKDKHPLRPEHVDQYLHLLDIGGVSSASITASEGKGKLGFLFEVLIPRLLKGGYVPVYTNLLNTPEAPHTSLLTALEETLRAMEETHGVSNLLASLEHRIENRTGDFRPHTTTVPPEAAQNQHLRRLNDLMVLLVEKVGKGRLLLIVDHFDYLATSPQFGTITYALRTQLDKRQDDIKSLFIGSPSSGMKTLLDNRQSAFYKFATDLPFFIG